MHYFKFFCSRWRVWGVLAVSVLITACASGSSRPAAPDLGPDPALLGVKMTWQAQLGAVDFPLEAKAVAGQVVLADANGAVVALDVRTGVFVWRADVGAPVTAGVGSDGRYAAVVTRGNDLVVLDSGREVWRYRVAAQVFTSPLVAGDRVFLLGADRSVSAFDAKSGRRLWQIQRPGESLVLRQAGVLVPFKNTLLVGFSGRVVALNPASGASLWDVAVASPRGTNDIERMVDLLAGVARQSNVVCIRSFFAAVACIDADTGKALWRQNAVGSVGLDGDANQVYGVEDDGRLIAWQMRDGAQIWATDKLRLRQLSAPRVLGRTIAVADDVGQVHWIGRSDGALLRRMPTDGSGIAATPILADATLVVVTRKGGVFGFQPD